MFNCFFPNSPRTSTYNTHVRVQQHIDNTNILLWILIICQNQSAAIAVAF